MSAAPQETAPTTLAFGSFVVDLRSEQLLDRGKPVHLSPKPFALLSYMAARPGVLVLKDELLDAVWGHRFVSESVLTGTVNAVRQALGEHARDARWVQTVPRRGYRFAAAGADDVPKPDAAPVGVTETPAPPPAKGNLPTREDLLVGRETDAQRLRDTAGQHRLLTLTGAGGVGKTSLALRCAAQDAPPDGVWLLRLDALGESDPVAPAIARVLGFSEGAGADAHRLGAALAPLQLRLLLDNAEHLADLLAPQLGVWLAAAPGLQVWVTSQRPLHVSGEQVLPLAPLRPPPPDAAPAEQRASPAVQLLLRRVLALEPEWSPSDADWHDMAEIARALDGMPLALELAAARVPLLGARGVRERLNERLRMLTRGASDAPQRHRTLRAALEWSIGLLPSEAAQLLELCSVFSGGFTLDAVQTLAAECLTSLDEWSLLDHMSLLREMGLVVDAGTPPTPLVPPKGSALAEHIALDWFAAPRMRLYDSVRLLGRERLQARGALAAAQGAHLRWVSALFERADHVQLELAEAVWLGPVEPEAANLSAAMGFAMERAQASSDSNDHQALVRLYAACVGFVIRSGMRHQATEWWATLKQLLRFGPQGEPPPDWPAELRARLDVAQLVLAQVSLAKIGEGIVAARRAAPLLAQSGQTRRLLLASYMLGLLELRAEGPQTARRTLEGMTALLGPQATVFERRLVPWALALMAREEGDLATFRRFYEHMLEESRWRGDRMEAWKAAWGFAQAQFLMGQLDAAIETFDRTVDDLWRAGRERSSGLLAGQGASIRLYRDASEESLRRARDAARLLRSDRLVSYSLGDALPWAAWWQGRRADAMQLLAWSDQMARERAERRGPISQRMRAEMLERLGQPEIPDATSLDDDGALRLALGESGT